MLTDHLHGLTEPDIKSVLSTARTVENTRFFTGIASCSILLTNHQKAPIQFAPLGVCTGNGSNRTPIRYAVMEYRLTCHRLLRYTKDAKLHFSVKQSRSVRASQNVLELTNCPAMKARITGVRLAALEDSEKRKLVAKPNISVRQDAREQKNKLLLSW